jgi:hypothetical protein
MKRSELTQIIKEEVTKIQEGFQGDGDEQGDGLSGFRGGGNRTTGDTLNDYDSLKVLMDMWEKIPLGIRMNQGGMRREIPKEIREKLNKMGYKLVKI